MRQAARLEFKPQARKETRQGSCIGQSAPVVLLFVAINQKKATKALFRSLHVNAKKP